MALWLAACTRHPAGAPSEAWKPEQIWPDDTRVIIEKGQLLTGILDKATLGEWWSPAHWRRFLRGRHADPLITTNTTVFVCACIILQATRAARCCTSS